MIRMQTLTQIRLRIELATLELQSIVARSVKAELLNDIIAYCVPKRLLSRFTIWGMKEGKGKLRLDVEIDYDEHDRQVKLHGEGLPDGIEGEYDLSSGPRKTDGEDPVAPKTCPYMGKAVDLYMNLIEERKLNMKWTVQFCRERAAMDERFNLRPVYIHDCTTDGVSNRVTSSQFSELSATVRASQGEVPNEP